MQSDCKFHCLSRPGASRWTHNAIPDSEHLAKVYIREDARYRPRHGLTRNESRVADRPRGARKSLRNGELFAGRHLAAGAVVGEAASEVVREHAASARIG
ncbi:hypothetical protein Pmani_020425 [Petrolisthes manimaculis]|uniref:Uncharacterized protein n=1 Tax=Petrolisthes manimaculis TaxID=1843537 RepID=A0AAE1PHS7_9EUCA|nr:hypothetical protein Pmani_020425 [Petrolisthes manimaculis]